MSWIAVELGRTFVVQTQFDSLAFESFRNHTKDIIHDLKFIVFRDHFALAVVGADSTDDFDDREAVSLHFAPINNFSFGGGSEISDHLQFA